jgi:ABC-type amino acid transport substrate-binding protein
MEITYHRPFAYYDVDAGQVTGFDVELATELARRLGVEREPVALPWDDLFAAVEDDRVDVVISAVTITEDRARRHGFSRPYFTTGQRLTARAADRRDFAAGSKASVGTQKGTSSETAARALPGAEVRVYDTLDLALAALSSSEIDLLVCDEALSPARSDPAFRFVGERLTSESYGVMMPRDDRPLAERVDTILGQLEAEGWLAALAARYGIGGGTE